MKLLDASSPEAQSADFVAENISLLKELFPDLLTEGPNGLAVNVDVLRTLVGDAAVTDADEKYGLSWHGKRRARQLALTPSTGTLRPYPEESVDWDTTKNLMIEGDNLDVLKLLQKSYAGKVKLIYIDPPYNTGEDFVYPDDYTDSINNYLELTGQIDGVGRKITSNPESSGRFHTNWLNMIYPRLKAAREILAKDGSIWVSVDGKELENLSSVLKEIFGTENFVGSFIWEKRLTRENRKVFSVNHDYILCATRDRVEFERVRGLLPLSSEAEGRYSNPDNDPRGAWQSVSLNAQSGHATKDQFYDFVTPGGRLIKLPPGRCWSVTRPKLEEMIGDNRVWFGVDGNNVPREKLFLSESNNGLVPHTLWSAEEVGTTDSAKKDMIALFGGEDIFDTPKPVQLIQRIIEIGSTDDEIVMDFFAGSGTTAHAVMAENSRAATSRKFILVQLPEPLDITNKDQKEAAQFCEKLGVPLNIAELTKERLRRSAKTVQADSPEFNGDLGFRAFKLDTSNVRAWNPKPADVAQAVIDYQDNLVEGRTEADVLYELLLKLGLDLCVPIEKREVAGKAVHSVGGGVLMACLAPMITREDVELLAQGIVAWYEELAPAGDSTCVFRDSAFADDVAKTNLAAILEQHGIKNVRSL